MKPPDLCPLRIAFVIQVGLTPILLAPSVTLLNDSSILPLSSSFTTDLPFLNPFIILDL